MPETGEDGFEVCDEDRSTHEMPWPRADVQLLEGAREPGHNIQDPVLGDEPMVQVRFARRMGSPSLNVLEGESELPFRDRLRNGFQLFQNMTQPLEIADGHVRDDVEIARDDFVYASGVERSRAVEDPSNVGGCKGSDQLDRLEGRRCGRVAGKRPGPLMQTGDGVTLPSRPVRSRVHGGGHRKRRVNRFPLPEPRHRAWQGRPATNP